MHWLIVPANPDHAMTVEHPIDCSTRAVEIVDTLGARTVDAPDCHVARVVLNYGLERWFGHALATTPDGYEAPWRAVLAPGSYALVLHRRPHPSGEQLCLRVMTDERAAA